MLLMSWFNRNKNRDLHEGPYPVGEDALEHAKLRRSPRRRGLSAAERARGERYAAGQDVVDAAPASRTSWLPGFFRRG